MIRSLLLLWAAPVGMFWGWYLLSSNDLIFSRLFHDRVFAIYGEMLDMEPAAIPEMMARALVIDSLILIAIAAWRKRRDIIRLYRRRFPLSSATADHLS